MWRDIYVLVARREEDYSRFTATFLTGLGEAADEYEYPQFASEPSIVTSDLQVVLENLFRDRTQAYGIYWNSSGETGILAAMAFFTADDGLILGLTVREDEAERQLRRLMNDLGSTTGGIFGEEPPPETAAEFRAALRATS